MNDQVTAIKSALPADLQREQARTTSTCRTAVDSITQRQIAALLYKRDSRNPRAILEDLDQVSQEKYMDAAWMVLRMVDEQFHVPALYAGVDAGDRFEGGDGLSTMAKDVRIHELERFEISLRAYRKHLAADMPANADRFRNLADSDRRKP